MLGYIIAIIIILSMSRALHYGIGGGCWHHHHHHHPHHYHHHHHHHHHDDFGPGIW